MGVYFGSSYVPIMNWCALIGIPPYVSSVMPLLSYLTLLPSQGLSSGFAAGEDEAYNVYDKPWRAGGGAAEKIYRPSKTMDKDIYGDDVEKLIKTSRFVWVGGWVYGLGCGWVCWALLITSKHQYTMC